MAEVMRADSATVRLIIEQLLTEGAPGAWSGATSHLIVVAEDSFSMFSIYARALGLPRAWVIEACRETNKRDDIGCMWPAAPVSVFPRRIMRDHDVVGTDESTHQFRLWIKEWLFVNGDTMFAQHVVVDLVFGESVPWSYAHVARDLLSKATLPLLSADLLTSFDR